MTISLRSCEPLRTISEPQMLRAGASPTWRGSPSVSTGPAKFNKGIFRSCGPGTRIHWRRTRPANWCRKIGQISMPNRSRNFPTLANKRPLACTLLLLLALFVVVTCNAPRSARERAWQQVQQASKNHNDLDTIQACEAYFATSPPRGPQALRNEEVLDLYQRALVRWYVHLQSEPDAKSLEHIRKYRALVVDSKPGR